MFEHIAEFTAWPILTDNRTQNPSLQTEHGLSILLETVKHRILLDTGASDAFIRNAEQLGIDLSTVDYVFISHGHSDHAGGLKHFLEINDKAKVIVSSDALKGKFFSKRRYLHSITTEWPKIPQERLLTIEHSESIDEDIFILAHIPQIHPIPEGNQYLFVEDTDGRYVSEDKLSELAYRLMDAYPQTQFYTSHCTGDTVFATLHQVMGDKIHAFY